MSSLLGRNDPSFSVVSGAPLVYGHAPISTASESDSNLEVFVVASNTPLLPVVIANRSHRSVSDMVVAICLDVTLEDACVAQCQQILDQVAQCCSDVSATGAGSDFKPAIVVFACKGDLCDVTDDRWDLISARLRLLALKCCAAFAVQSSSTGCSTSRQIILSALQLASWPAPSLQRISFFVPPNHDSAPSLRVIVDKCDNVAPTLSSSSSKTLDAAPLKPAHVVSPDDDQVDVRVCRVHSLVSVMFVFIFEFFSYHHSACLSLTWMLQDFIATQVPAVNLEDVELRRKFSAVISSAILKDSWSASDSNSGVAAVPSSKAAPVAKTRDANVRRDNSWHRGHTSVSLYSTGCRGIFR